MQSLELFVLILLNWSASFSFALAAAFSNAQQQRTVLVTGGAGYIGSHTCVELLSLPEYNVVVVDNLDNSSEESLKRVSELTGCDPKRLVFRNCDLRDKEGLQKSMREICWL
jgi:nucleoside-diphosphate-sugar epimerase